MQLRLHQVLYSVKKLFIQYRNSKSLTAEIIAAVSSA